MKSIKQLYPLLAVALLAGCSGSDPKFKSSEGAQNLFGDAQAAVESELKSAFGTPTNLVVWQELPVDFGSYGGTVKKQPPRAGAIQFGSADVDADADYLFGPISELARQNRLPLLSGSAVLIAPAATEKAEGEEEKPADSEETKPTEEEATEPEAPTEPPQAYRVGSFDVDTQTLKVVDTEGNPASFTLTKGDRVEVIGDGLQRGRDLYLRHCVHCHGVSGDGNGPTAQYLTPKPRDYRKGVFKFTSTKPGIRASRDDLFRIVKLGVAGTYMPSFMLLPDDEVSSIVEYIRWLSMRGEMEGKLTVQLELDYSKGRLEKESFSEVSTEFKESMLPDIPDMVDSIGDELKVDWTAPEQDESVVMPTDGRVEADAESIARGRKLFLSAKLKCFSCHGETGRGNGVATEEINDKPGQPGVKADEPGLFDVWGNIVKPRNLTRGLYRGGRRPVDVYRRIYSGIKGTPMQAFGNNLKDPEIWDLVNYVQSIPFQKKKSSHP